MRLLANLSVRALLILLVSLATLPALAIILINGIETSRLARETSRAAGADLVRDLAAAYRQEEFGAHRLLLTLGAVPCVRARDRAACGELLKQVLDQSPEYNALLAVGPDGVIFASGRPLVERFDVSDRKYFRDAMASGEFSVGEYIVSRASHNPMINFALPVMGAGGEIVAVLVVGIPPARLEAHLADASIPPGGAVAVTDHDGRILFDQRRTVSPAESGDPEGLVRSMPNESGGLGESAGSDGMLVAYRWLRMRPGAPRYMCIRFTIPEAAVFAHSRNGLILSLGLLGLAALLALGASRLIGLAGIAGPVGRLAVAARRVADGDLTARAGNGEGRGELGLLARAFDEMAATLQTREADRLRAAQEQVALEERLRHSQKLEAVGRLAGGVAHDFNNLLTAIRGSAQLALEDLPLGSPGRADLEEIDRSAQRAAALTRQLLAFSRRQVLAPRLVDMTQTVRVALQMLARLVGEDVTLDLEAPSGALHVRVDPAQIDQILANLVVNARDAMPDGGAITIKLRSVVIDEAYAALTPHAKPGHWVELTVSDTGTGMSPEVKHHLYEPFFTTKPKGTGTGLGLATVHGIVHQTGGFIVVFSEVGAGTTFRIHLPAAAEGERDLPLASARAPRPGTETVLIVEDEATVREVARRVLQRQGYDVMAVATPEEAVAALDGRVVHLLLTDVIMPEVNGRELAARLTSIQPSLRTLFMSGYSANILAPHGVLAPGMAFLEKPFTVEALSLRVREVLDAAPETSDHPS
jgi:signal transduction histidine kinase/CheY-like chemotaxis protein